MERGLIEGRFKCVLGCGKKEVYFMLLYTVHYHLLLLLWTFSSDCKPFDRRPVQCNIAFQTYLETDRTAGGYWLQMKEKMKGSVEIKDNKGSEWRSHRERCLSLFILTAGHIGDSHLFYWCGIMRWIHYPLLISLVIMISHKGGGMQTKRRRNRNELIWTCRWICRWPNVPI